MADAATEADVQEAVVEFEAAYRLADPPSSIVTGMLALALSRRAHFLRPYEDLDRIVELAQQAAVQREIDRGIEPDVSVLEADARLLRHRRFGWVDDLQQAIAIFEALGPLVTRPGVEPSGGSDLDAFLLSQPERVGSHQVDYAAALQTRYELLGDPADIDTAITIFQSAFRNLDETRWSTHPGTLSRIAAALMARYWRDGARADLDQTIALRERSVSTSSTPDRIELNRRASLGHTLVRRGCEDGDQAEISRGIHLLEDAAERAPRAMRRAADPLNLAEALLDWLEHGGDPALLARASRLVDEADSFEMQASTVGFQLHLSARVSWHQFERSGDPRDALAARRAIEDSLALTAPAHRDRPQRMAFLEMVERSVAG